MRFRLLEAIVHRCYGRTTHGSSPTRWQMEKDVFCVHNVDRFYSRWKSSLEDGRTPITEEIPWISFEAADYLASYLNDQMTVFEFGSGGSTIFFAKRVRRLISIEHDQKWFSQVSEAMTIKRLHNWEGHCIPPEQGVLGGARPYHPDDFSSGAFGDMNFKEYVSAIDSHADNSFDVVMVDGRARPSCLKHALSKTKSQGLLVLDNADRSYYTALVLDQILSQFVPVLDRSGPFPFVADFLKTTIWKKI